MISGQQLSNDMTRRNNAKMAIIWQHFCDEQHILAQLAFEAGRYKHAAFHQRQGARDHRQMIKFLIRAI